jgi:hypothetical protein
VIHFTRFSLLLGMAASLAAQNPTLSFGEISLVTPATKTAAAIYNVDLVLSTTGTTYTGQFAGLQFDLNYDPTSFTITPGVGAQTGGMQVNWVALSSSLSNPFCAPTVTPCVAPQNNGPGLRAIIIGCCANGQTTPTSTLIAQDGVVATLQVQATSSVTNPVLTLKGSPYLAGTTSGINAQGQNTGATSIKMAIGAGASDPTASGSLSLQNVYLEGSLSTITNDNSPNFGSGQVKLADLILELLYETGAPGYALPLSCTDLFDAMDVSPADTDAKRGGDGVVNLNDLILELLRETGAPGYSTLPVRTPRGLTCTASVGTNERAALEVRGTLEFGPTEGAGTSQERTPVYLRAGRDLARVGVAFSAGDEKSQLQFEAAAGMSPSLMYNSQPGFVSVAFLQGMDARAGNRTLLGYIVGPAGSGANLKVFGTQATGLNDFEVFGIDFGGRSVRQ